MKYSLTFLAVASFGKLAYGAVSTFDSYIQSEQKRVLKLIQDDVEQKNPRSLQLLDSFFNKTETRVCNLIEQQFNGTVDCECLLSPATSSIGYSCSFVEEACAGSACGIVTTSGSVDVKALSASAQTCVTSLNVNVNDICVNVTYSLLDIGSGTALACRASVEDLVCASCLPCRGGISLDCSNVIDDGPGGSCEALDFVSTIGLGKPFLDEQISPFLPSFLGNL